MGLAVPPTGQRDEGGGSASERSGTSAPIAALVVHARLRMLPWVLGIVLFGYGFVHWDQDLYLVEPGRLGLLLVAWTFGHAGTMWLNAALDREEGAAIFTRGSAIPRGLHGAAYVALVLSVGVAAAANTRAAGCAFGCALLAVMYSHPRLAWKGHPLGGPLVNVLGYGVFSPLAGAAVASESISVRLVVTLALWSLWLFGAYLSAQSFQEADDRRRGYRTFVVTHGPPAALAIARRSMNAAISGAFVLTLIGIYPRLPVLAFPGFLVADAWMRRWQLQSDGGGPDWAVGLFRRMVAVGLCVFVLAWCEYWFF
ncbi:MAG: UbiA prenyltransferase family protein [Polyangiaceae bacterium]|nr:UbiA prenyltransferase family protein [Polyangiaceae bacterium]